jgi:hypothetical protein
LRLDLRPEALENTQKRVRKPLRGALGVKGWGPQGVERRVWGWKWVGEVLQGRFGGRSDCVSAREDFGRRGWSRLRLPGWLRLPK